MDKQLLDHIAGELAKSRAGIEQALVSGGSKDYAEYRELVGVRRGLNMATGIIDDLLERLNQGEEND